MRDGKVGNGNGNGRFSLVASLALSAVLWSTAARAQTPEVPAAPAMPDPGAPPVAMPPPPPAMPPPPPAPMAPPPMPDAKPPTSSEAMPATRPDALPPIDVGAWVRAGGVFQGSDMSKINDWHMDTAFIELHAGGKVHKNVGVTLNLAGNMANWASPSGDMGMPGNASYVTIEDAIISFDFDDAFHLWTGRLLVPVDRANASGPFFMIPWNYPGFSASPHEGPLGRNEGAVIWGDVLDKRLTYLVGAFDNANVASSPLYSGRLRLALWDTEPGFFGNGSFFGEKDILSFGVGGQYQKHGSAGIVGVTPMDKDWADVNVDALLEKKIPSGGWATLEGAYYHFNVLDGAASDTFYVLGAYASPVVGVGNIQPMVRYQFQKIKNGAGSNPYNIDGAVAYLIKGPALRVIATYTHAKAGSNPLTGSAITANSIQFGAQAIFF